MILAGLAKHAQLMGALLKRADEPGEQRGGVTRRAGHLRIHAVVDLI